jgi:transcriptional regulator with XRE-family HTH domain
MLSVDLNLMPLLQQDSFERWDLEEPRRPCPSVLYALTPCGLGTPYVESFSSYVTRLAEGHVVTVWRLIRHVFPQSLRRIPRCETRYAYPANGLGKTSHIFLDSFQAATGRDDLRLLTLSALQRAVSQPNIFRTTEAWCPGCLEHWRTIDEPIYSPLLWTIRAVTLCPVHASPLRERCPHCNSRFASLRVNARPGYCAICSQWLGSFDLPLSQDSVDEQQYNLWASASIGQVVAEMPDLEPNELQLRLIANLKRCLRQSEGMTKQGLSALAGAGPCAFGAWTSGRVKPTLHHLCRLSYELKIPLIMLFKGVLAEWRGPEHLPQRFAPRKRPEHSVVGKPQLRETLAICLTEAPAPSVAEVARRLNFRRAQTLWFREPQLCRQIAARHRDSPTIRHAAEHRYKRSEWRRLESALRRHLARKDTLSLNEIASVLGYKGSSSIRSRFPEICSAIITKRKEQSFRRGNRCGVLSRRPAKKTRRPA